MSCTFQIVLDPAVLAAAAEGTTVAEPTIGEPLVVAIAVVEAAGVSELVDLAIDLEEQADPQPELTLALPEEALTTENSPQTATVTNAGSVDLDSIQAVSNTPEVAIENTCLLYTSPSPRDQRGSRMPSSA